MLSFLNSFVEVSFIGIQHLIGTNTNLQTCSNLIHKEQILYISCLVDTEEIMLYHKRRNSLSLEKICLSQFSPLNVCT
jgi:hypothetical protein